MIKAHIYVRKKLITNIRINHPPRVGDEVRWGGENHEKYAKITRVVWCLDEDSPDGDRINVEAVKFDE